MDGPVYLRHNDVNKLATAATGVNVTGSLAVDTITNASSSTDVTIDTNFDIVLDAGGGVGIGTSSPSDKLTLTAGQMRLSDNYGIRWGDASAGIYGNGASDYLQFITASTERMRIDSSGNLLVGKTSADSGATAGIETNNNGRLNATRNGSISGVFNRLTSDGDIVQFRKDGSAVGSIGAGSGDLIVGNGSVGVRFNDSISTLVPRTTADGASDGAIDIGAGSARFKDLYLSGGVYLGGTGAANKLSDYETGTWSPAVNVGTINALGAKYTKVGNTVHLRCNLGDISDSSTNTIITLTGLPYAPISSNVASGSCMFRYFNRSNATQMNPYIGGGSTVTFYWSNLGNLTWLPVKFEDGQQNNMDIIFTITYETAS